MELKPEEIVYKINFDDMDLLEAYDKFSVNAEIYSKIKSALQIKKCGYNVYLIEDYSREKLIEITDFINNYYENKGKPYDICYVIKNGEKHPEVMFVNNGFGSKMKCMLEELQSSYNTLAFDFYNGSECKTKEDLIDQIHKKRSDTVGKLIKKAKDEGFDMKTTSSGFSFIPVKDGELMSENEYDSLDENLKSEIIEKVSVLRIQVQDELEVMKDDEVEVLDDIKKLMSKHFDDKLQGKKAEIEEVFKDELEALKFLKEYCQGVEDKLSENYSLNYDEDEEDINEAILSSCINVIVDNSGNENRPVIFEEDPSLENLLGSIEYENKNGVYSTDISLIKSGSLLKANGGCLILRLSSLFANPQAYYYLKKCLLSGKVDLDYNRGYLELLSLNGLKPKPISISTKIILIGDAESYDVLYSYDEDFKKIFGIKAEYNPYIKISGETKKALFQYVNSFCIENDFKKLNIKAMKEVAKYLSRKAEDANKFTFTNHEIGRLITLSNNETDGEEITENEILKIINEEELIEKELLEYYKSKKIISLITGSMIGSINGLSVIDTGYYSFGKPIRITCTCYKGSGEIIDVQKESNMSGNIHIKSINILKGYIRSLIGPYNDIPMDFHLSFEQLYGKIDGDSASVAETVCMISALSKLPIKQSIAVTGSINQFGVVQPIGGVNEKIEGFFKVCKLLDNTKNKGVLIPASNVDNLVLSSEVEDAIINGDFHIYSMETVEDALEILIGDEDNTMSADEILNEMLSESKKYENKKKRSK